MKKISRREKVLNAKRQLAEYIRLSIDERFKNYYKLKHSILRLYNIILTNGLNTLDYFDFDRVSSDNLFMDIELIPYFIDENSTISYIRYDLAKNLPYPSGEYEVIEPSCGKYKLKGSSEVLYSHLLAIDYSLKNFAQRWYDYIPTILELLDQKV